MNVAKREWCQQTHIELGCCFARWFCFITRWQMKKERKSVRN